MYVIYTNDNHIYLSAELKLSNKSKKLEINSYNHLIYNLLCFGVYLCGYTMYVNVINYFYMDLLFNKLDLLSILSRFTTTLAPSVIS